jgi:hypothetical protein
LDGCQHADKMFFWIEGDFEDDANMGSRTRAD